MAHHAFTAVTTHIGLDCLTQHLRLVCNLTNNGHQGVKKHLWSGRSLADVDRLDVLPWHPRGGAETSMLRSAYLGSKPATSRVEVEIVPNLGNGSR